MWLYHFIEVSTREISFKNIVKKLQKAFIYFFSAPIVAILLVRKVVMHMVVLEPGYFSADQVREIKSK